MVKKQIWNGIMIKQSKLFKDLRKQGTTIKQTRKGHYMVVMQTKTYTLSNRSQYPNSIIKHLFATIA